MFVKFPQRKIKGLIIPEIIANSSYVTFINLPISIDNELQFDLYDYFNEFGKNVGILFNQHLNRNLNNKVKDEINDEILLSILSSCSIKFNDKINTLNFFERYLVNFFILYQKADIIIFNTCGLEPIKCIKTIDIVQDKLLRDDKILINLHFISNYDIDCSRVPENTYCISN